MASPLENAILEVIVYFDLFSYPLTALEVWRNLGVCATYAQVDQTLWQSVWLKARLDFQRGMWSLKPSLRDETSSLSDERNRRYRVSKHKIDRARRFARLARFIPWVRTIYACNSLGFLQAKPESDIDLFIVVNKGRIWSARFFSVLLAKLFFGRPTRAHATDGICLSFFAVQGAHLSKMALPGGDVYYEHWQKNLLPLTSLTRPPPACAGRATLSRRERGWGEGIGRVVERVLRWIQLKILPTPLKALANKGTSVVLNDEFLKFHDHDRRDYFRKEFARRAAAIGA